MKANLFDEYSAVFASERAHYHERRAIWARYLAWAFFLGDTLFIACGLISGYLMRFAPSKGYDVSTFSDGLNSYLPQFLFSYFVLMGLLIGEGRYRRATFLRPRLGALMMLKPVIFWACSVLGLSLILKIDPNVSRLFVLYSACFLALYLCIWRYLFTRFFVITHFCDLLSKKTLVVGLNQNVIDMWNRSLDPVRLFPLKIEGVIATDDFPLMDPLPRSVGVWDSVDALDEILAAKHFDAVLLADSSLNLEKTRLIQRSCAREMLEFMIMPNRIEHLTRCLHVETIQGVPFLTQAKRPLDRLENMFIKRAVDIVGALVGLTLFAPVIGYFAWRVYRESPGPVFYRQVRTGKHGKPFEIIKIRSMKLDAESQTGAVWCKAEDSRRLKVGEFMRRTNIDELPQFWNVLKGDMSLVGPRPERPELIHDFKSKIGYYNTRHTIKPGLTGWAQVNGWRGDTCIRSRIACDIEYIERASIWFDLYIIIRTLNSNKNAY